MNKSKKIKVKTKDQEINELLTDFEKYLVYFKLDIDNKDKKLKEYIRLLEFARNEYRKVVQENNLLKRQILGLRQSRPKQSKKQTKRKYIVENSDNETDSPYESDYQENEEKEEDQYPEIKEKKVKTKTVEKPNQNKKQKLFEYINKKNNAVGNRDTSRHWKKCISV